MLPKFLNQGGTTVCASCRSRHELSNEYLLPVFIFKNRLRYSREWAAQGLSKIRQKKFPTLEKKVRINVGTITCDTGYFAAAGVAPDVVSCDHGSWSSRTLVCEQLDCGDHGCLLDPASFKKS